MKIKRTGYDTEAVRQMLEEALAEPQTLGDVANKCRPGGLLEKAHLRGSFFDGFQTRRIMTDILRRRLAAQLGRKSPRLLGPEADIDCISCGGIAVKWDGRWLCENGHGGNTNA